jgi:hypothetical protein
VRRGAVPVLRVCTAMISRRPSGSQERLSRKPFAMSLAMVAMRPRTGLMRGSFQSELSNRVTSGPNDALMPT